MHVLKNIKMLYVAEEKMTHRMEPCTALPLPADQLLDLVDKAKDFALVQGMYNILSVNTFVYRVAHPA
jgi:hypothetical protein